MPDKLVKSIGSSVLLLLFLSTNLLSQSVRAQSDSPEDVLAGRLGGQLQTFVARFGDPVGVNEAAGSVFTAEGYGLIFVQIDHVQGTVDPEGRTRGITASSPRAPDLAATEPDEADWSLDEAIERARSLLPTDVQLSEFIEAESGELTATCRSDALEELFGVLTLGQCRVTLILPTPKTVSFATLSLTAGSVDAGPEATPAVNPCEGAVDWIKQAGERLEETQGLLEGVTAIDEHDPGSPATLREIAESFRRLAGDQRKSEPPDAAAQANFYLVSALTSYADAVETAAEGLETGDEHLIEEAVGGFEDAGKLVTQATDEIKATGETCSLQLGAPVAEASPQASLPS
jgi:hypothetical protein